MSENLEDKSYIDILKFDKNLLKSLPAFYLKNIRLMIIVLLSILLMGVYSYIKVPRTLNPEVKLPIIYISTVFPGAGPDEVESLLTIPLEDSIKKVKGISDYSSTSEENISLIQVQFESGIDPKEARDDIQAAVDQVKDLPADSQEPNVQAIDFENYPVWIFTLVNKETDDTSSLYKKAELLKKDIEELSEVSSVSLSGFDNREIVLYIRKEFIESHQVNPMLIKQAVTEALSSYPVGNVQTDNSKISVVVKQAALSLEQLRATSLTIKNTVYQLQDIADIYETSNPEMTGSYLISKDQDLTQAVTFYIYKTTDSRIDETYQNVKKVVDESIALETQFEVKSIQNYAMQIEDQFADLFDNFLQTLLLVFASMLLLYGIRQAFIAALAIPFSLLITFAVMYFSGISLNFLSIFSLLIALGLFVDNAVVIIEGFTSYYSSQKFSPLEAAILVWQDYSVELLSINILTIWAFLPLLVTSGIIGEFIQPLPIIVSATMLASVFVALFFTLPSMMILAKLHIPKRLKILFNLLIALFIIILPLIFIPKTILFLPTFLISLLFLYSLLILRKRLAKKLAKYLEKHRQLLKFIHRSLDKGFISLAAISQKYEIILDKLLNSRSLRIKTMLVIILFTLFSYLLLPLGLVENEFFPKSDYNFLYLSLELPEGTNATVTNQVLIELLKEYRNLAGSKYLLGELKQSMSTYGSSSSKDNQALITIVLNDRKERFSDSTLIAENLRSKLNNFSKAKIQVLEESSGPPVGSDINLKILGKDLNKLQVVATEVETYLKEQEGVVNVNQSIKAGISKISFIADNMMLEKYQTSASEIAMWIRIYLAGFELDDYAFTSNDERSIMLRFNRDMLSPEDLQGLPISTAKGYVNLGTLGKFMLEENPTLITRENGERTIQVEASVKPGFNIVKINKKLQDYVAKNIKLEKGYHFDTGGANEENEKSVQSILEAMIISAILILATMVLQLGSFRKAFIVMLVIPLAVSGVFIWFALTGTPLSFPSLIGLLSLFGLVIANSLMIVDKVNKNLEAGFAFKKAIIEAASSRLEPIALTSGSQIIGLIPITLSDPMWQGMGGAIIAGLSFSGILMLLFIPIVYYYLFPELSKAFSVARLGKRKVRAV